MMNKFKDILIQDTLLFHDKRSAISFFLVEKKEHEFEPNLIVFDDDKGYLTHNVVFYISENGMTGMQELHWGNEFSLKKDETLRSIEDIENRLIEWIEDDTIEEMSPIQKEIYDELIKYKQK